MENSEQNGHGVFWLHLHSWWAGSGMGTYDLFVYPDGYFIKKSTHYSPWKEPKESADQGDGQLDSEGLKKVRDFVTENVKESSESMLFDAGMTVEVFLEGKHIKIVNNMALYSKISDLLPESTEFITD